MRLSVVCFVRKSEKSFWQECLPLKGFFFSCWSFFFFFRDNVFRKETFFFWAGVVVLAGFMYVRLFDLARVLAFLFGVSLWREFWLEWGGVEFWRELIGVDEGATSATARLDSAWRFLVAGRSLTINSLA